MQTIEQVLENDTQEKTYTINMTESQVITLSELLQAIIENTDSSSNEPEIFIEMLRLFNEDNNSSSEYQKEKRKHAYQFVSEHIAVDLISALYIDNFREIEADVTRIKESL